jgi:hypothetical protein
VDATASEKALKSIAAVSRCIIHPRGWVLSIEYTQCNMRPARVAAHLHQMVREANASMHFRLITLHFFLGSMRVD